MRRLAGGEELGEGVKVMAFDQVRDVKFLGTHKSRLALHAELPSNKHFCLTDTPRPRSGKGEASYTAGRGSDGTGGGSVFYEGNPCDRTFGG